jgi:hypothetical protein
MEIRAKFFRLLSLITLITSMDASSAIFKCAIDSNCPQEMPIRTFCYGWCGPDVSNQCTNKVTHSSYANGHNSTLDCSFAPERCQNGMLDCTNRENPSLHFCQRILPEGWTKCLPK